MKNLDHRQLWYRVRVQPEILSWARFQYWSVGLESRSIFYLGKEKLQVLR